MKRYSQDEIDQHFFKFKGLKKKFNLEFYIKKKKTFKSEVEIKTFSGKQKLRKFIAIVEEVLQAKRQ